MPLDAATLATVNLAAQVLLMATVMSAAYLARRRSLQAHCTVLRAAVVLQLVSVAVVMLPSLAGTIREGRPGIITAVEMGLHGTLGVAVIAVWVYINLAFKGMIKPWGRLVTAMRLGLALWGLSFVLGLHMYTVIWS